ncbi:hypothetical protein ACFL28_00155, partial [Candidatus Omnitrophota bacterium]
MKKLIMILFILGFAAPALALTVGSPEIGMPEESLFLKGKVVNETLDRYDYIVNIKTGVDIEIVTERELTSAPADTPSAELKGRSYMLKVSNSFSDLFEPYVKLGTSDFEVKWDQRGNNIEVEANPGFTWGVGAKAKLLESKAYGIKLALDAQYRNTDLSFDKAKIGGATLTASASNEVFEIEEWQASLLVSKRFIFPLGANDIYIVPYAGTTYSSVDVDVGFIQTTTGGLFSTYNA